MKILVTGGARRLGRFFVKTLASQGNQVAIHYNSSSAQAEELLREIGGAEKGHAVFQANLSDLSEAQKLIDNCVADWGQFDLLINSASTYFCRGMSGIRQEDLMDDFVINFMSPFMLMQHFEKHCGRGQIINILDNRVNYVDADAGPYALAKKSLRDATEACAQEWQGKIRVNAVAPGNVLNPGLEIEGNMNEDIVAIMTTIENFIKSDESGVIRAL